MTDAAWYVMIAVFAGVGWMVIRGVRKDSGDVGSPLFQAWTRYAHEHGLEAIPPGMLLGENSPMVTGTLDEIPIRVDIQDTRAGDKRALYTRVAATAQSPLEVHVRVEARSADLPEGLEALATLDAAFDEDFVVTANRQNDGPRAAVALLGAEVRDALVTLRGRGGVRLDYERGEITLSWRGAEADTSMLDAACHAVVALARHRPTTGGYR